MYCLLLGIFYFTKVYICISIILYYTCKDEVGSDEVVSVLFGPHHSCRGQYQPVHIQVIAVHKQV